MVRLAWMLTLSCVVGSVCLSNSAHALSIPGVDRKKEKADKAEEDRKKAEAQKAASKKEETAPEAAPATAKAGGGEPAPRQEVAAPATPVVVTETTLSKEGWEEYKKNKVGAFVEYSMPAQPGMKMRSEVVEVGDNFIVVLQTTSGTGFSQVSKNKMIFKDGMTEKVKAGNKEFTATRMEITSSGQTTRSWSSKEVPNLMGGLVKSENAGVVNMELTDFGFGK